jgi:hypothetical protein
LRLGPEWLRRAYRSDLATEPGVGMLTRTTLLLTLHAGAVLAVASSAFAQDASRDRAELDAAAGRAVFQNVLLADPQAFASRRRITPEPARRAIETPAPTGEASADRRQLDAAAGRAILGGTVPASSASTRDQAAGPRQRSVRVILDSPYGR